MYIRVTMQKRPRELTLMICICTRRIRARNCWVEVAFVEHYSHWLFLVTQGMYIEALDYNVLWKLALMATSKQLLGRFRSILKIRRALSYCVIGCNIRIQSARIKLLLKRVLRSLFFNFRGRSVPLLSLGAKNVDDLWQERYVLSYCSFCGTYDLFF